MNTESEALDIQAALVFDRASLRGSKAVGAQAFLQIFDLHWPRTTDGDLPDSVLGRAAVGLKDVFSDDVSTGREHFSVLAQADGDDESSLLTRLLGRALLIWSMKSEESGDEIARAASEVLRHADAHLVALYLLKLTGFALDAGRPDQASQLLSLSQNALPDDRVRLRWRLDQIEARLRGGMLFTPSPQQVDPLADFPWIEDSAAALSKKFLTTLAEQKVEDPWRRTLHFGMTQVDSITAAVLQAEWAGALWLLPQLRLQQASTLILAGGRNTGEWEHAASNWVLGGGTHLRDVMQALEPHFERQSARRLVVEHLAGGRRVRSPDRYVDLLLSIWDLVEAEVATKVLQEFRPSVGEQGHRDSVNALWTVLGAIVPEVWSDELARLAPEEQSALLPHVTVGLLQRIPDLALAILTTRCIEDTRRNVDAGARPEPEPYRAASKLVRALGSDSVVGRSLLPLLREAPEEFRPELATDVPELGEVFGVTNLLEVALSELQAEAAKVSRGIYAVYARSPVDVAARLAVTFSGEPVAKGIVETIADLARDPTVMVEVRIEAVQALYRLALSHEFDATIARYVQERTEFRRDPFRSGDDVAFQRALWNASSFVVAPSSSKLPAILAESRDEDPRVRRIAVQGLGDDLNRVAQVDGIEELVCWSAVVGAIFDPAPSVVTLSLDLIAKAARVPDELANLVSDRLNLLFRQGGRDVRASVVRACRRLSGGAEGWPEILGVLEDAQSDRSWLVRDAATV